jgi:hypothetical protein
VRLVLLISFSLLLYLGSGTGLSHVLQPPPLWGRGEQVRLILLMSLNSSLTRGSETSGAVLPHVLQPPHIRGEKQVRLLLFLYPGARKRWGRSLLYVLLLLLLYPGWKKQMSLPLMSSGLLIYLGARNRGSWSSSCPQTLSSTGVQGQMRVVLLMFSNLSSTWGQKQVKLVLLIFSNHLLYLGTRNKWCWSFS